MKMMVLRRVEVSKKQFYRSNVSKACLKSLSAIQTKLLGALLGSLSILSFELSSKDIPFRKVVKIPN